MIKLSLIAKPTELTDEVEAQLTEEFKRSGKEVWKKPYIADALLQMTHNKCAYSEQLLNQESAYMEIDHFRCKDQYPDEVVHWGNLLPSCKKCNTTKGSHDVGMEPIVNPLVDNPKDFLYIEAFRYYSRNHNAKGQSTIGVLALNDRLHFTEPRSRIGFHVVDDIETLFEKLKSDDTDRKRRNTISKIKSTLEGCGPEYEYSAVISTYILYECDTYKEMESYLVEHRLWDDEFQAIKDKMLSVAMPKNTEPTGQ